MYKNICVGIVLIILISSCALNSSTQQPNDQVQETTSSPTPSPPITPTPSPTSIPKVLSNALRSTFLFPCKKGDTPIAIDEGDTVQVNGKIGNIIVVNWDENNLNCGLALSSDLDVDVDSLPDFPTYKISVTIENQNPLSVIDTSNTKYLSMVRVFGTGRILGVTYSPDDKYIIVVTSIGINTYDATTFEKVSEIVSAADVVGFQPNGEKILTSSNGSKIVNKFIWNPDQGNYEQGKTISVNSLIGNEIAVSPDGKLFASPPFSEFADTYLYDMENFRKNAVTIYNISDGSTYQELINSSNLFSIKFSPIGDTILAGGRHQLSLFQVSNGNLIWQIGQESDRYSNVNFLPGELVSAKLRKVITGISSSNIGTEVYQASDGKPFLLKILGKIWVDILEVSPDNSHLVFSSNIFGLVDFETEKTTIIDNGRFWMRPIDHLAFSHDSKSVLSAESRGTDVQIWDVDTRELVGSIDGFSGDITGADISPDDKTVVYSSSGGKVYVWNIWTGRLETTLGDRTWGVNDVKFSPDGKYIAASVRFSPYTNEVSKVNLWTLSNMQLDHSYKNKSNDEIFFSPDSKYLAITSGFFDEIVGLWKTNDSVNRVFVAPCRFCDLSFSSDNKMLATNTENIFKVVRVSNGSALKTIYFEKYADPNYSFIPGEPLFILVNYDTQDRKKSLLQLWDINSWQVLDSKTIDHLFTELAASPNGEIIALGDIEGNILI
jgi:WD40 repeat protein